MSRSDKFSLVASLVCFCVSACLRHLHLDLFQRSEPRGNGYAKRKGMSNSVAMISRMKRKKKKNPLQECDEAVVVEVIRIDEGEL